jgi:cytoskeletal protein CcmA (bactofilin family)
MSQADELNAAVANVRRSASNSVMRFKTAAGLGNRGELASFEPVNERIESAPARPDPTIISAHTEMKGSISTTDEMHLHGRIEGDVRASKIVVCATGAVKGDLVAETVVIHGSVDGRINATHVQLHAGAVVKGEITHATLGVDTAAVLEGSLKRITRAESIDVE